MRTNLALHGGALYESGLDALHLLVVTIARPCRVPEAGRLTGGATEA